MQEKGATEDEMVGWRCRFDGHEFEQAPGDGGGQGSLACWSPWGRKDLDMTEGLNSNNKESNKYLPQFADPRSFFSCRYLLASSFQLVPNSKKLIVPLKDS